MVGPRQRNATYDDLLALPDNLVGERVGHVWFVDPTEQLLEALVLDGETYRIARVESGETKVRIPPFDAIELDLAALWAR